MWSAEVSWVSEKLSWVVVDSLLDDGNSFGSKLKPAQEPVWDEVTQGCSGYTPSPRTLLSAMISNCLVWNCSWWKVRMNHVLFMNLMGVSQLLSKTQNQGPSHGGSYMDEGTFCIRIGLPPHIVSGDCLASALCFLDCSLFTCAWFDDPDDTGLY